jgi:hypothetical protein
MEPDAEQGWAMKLIQISLKAPWLVWLLILLAVYMVIASPSTLVAIFVFIDHLFLTVASGFTHFIDSALK